MLSLLDWKSIAFFQTRQTLQSLLPFHVFYHRSLTGGIYTDILTQQHDGWGVWWHTKCDLLYLDVCTSPVERGLQGWAEQPFLSCWLLAPKISQHGKQLQSQMQEKNKGQRQQKLKFNKLLRAPKCVYTIYFPLQSQGWLGALRFHDLLSTISQKIKTHKGVTACLYMVEKFACMPRNRARDSVGTLPFGVTCFKPICMHVNAHEHVSVSVYACMCVCRCPHLPIK